MSKKETHYNPEELIIGYLNKELTREEIAFLEEWVDADSSHKKVFYEMTELWITTKALTPDQKRSDAAYQRELIRIKKSTKKKVRWMPYLRTVAAVLGGIIVLASGYLLGTKNTNSVFTSNIQTFEVPMGSRSKTTLPDGSVVWLNSGSKLTYSAGFSALDRTVELIGQGYFEVASNPKLPFLVVTDDIDVEVLGTKFDVKAYRDEMFITVTLAEGSVKFINKDSCYSFVMEPLEQAIYNRNTKLTAVKRAPENFTGYWITGAHFFYEMTMEQIARQLEKSFDVRIVFENEEKRSLTFYADFNENYTVDQILDVISITQRIRYEKKDNLIKIY